jgi:hypothetical protein
MTVKQVMFYGHLFISFCKHTMESVRNFKIEKFMSMFDIIDRNKCKFQGQMICYAKTR